MATLAYIVSIIVAVLAGLVATAWITGTLKPLVVYVLTYYTEGRSTAEEKALDTMGESKISYGIKGERYPPIFWPRQDI